MENLMRASTDNLYENITLNDVQLAAAYYPLLIDLAKHKHCLTYGELVDQAKETYPDLEYVQNAIAVSTGRKLDVVRMFTNERELPDVTSLIINKGQIKGVSLDSMCKCNTLRHHMSHDDLLSFKFRRTSVPHA
jgi:hypothetical protein